MVTGKVVDTLIVFIFKSLIVANGGKFYLPIHGIINYKIITYICSILKIFVFTRDCQLVS